MNNTFPINSNSNDHNINNLYRSKSHSKKDKKPFSIKSMKNNTITSLNDVEYFLNKLHHTIRYIKLYKLLK